MPRYLHKFTYSKEAVKGLVSKPENRIEAIRPLIEAAGGKLIDALTVSMAAGSSGAIADLSTTALIQIDDAVKAAERAGTLTGLYRAPGQ